MNTQATNRGLLPSTSVVGPTQPVQNVGPENVQIWRIARSFINSVCACPDGGSCSFLGGQQNTLRGFTDHRLRYSALRLWDPGGPAKFTVMAPEGNSAPPINSVAVSAYLTGRVFFRRRRSLRRVKLQPRIHPRWADSSPRRISSMPMATAPGAGRSSITRFRPTTHHGVKRSTVTTTGHHGRFKFALGFA